MGKVTVNRKDTTRVCIVGAAALLCGAGMAGKAHAAMTYVNAQGNYGNERCLEGTTCVGGTYNGKMSIISILEADIGGTLTRVDDNLDIIWTNTIDNGGKVMTRARYASDTNKLGYDSGSGYDQILASLSNNNKVVIEHTSSRGSESASGFVVDNNLSNNWKLINELAGTPFAFVLKDKTDNTLWTSNNSGADVASGGYSNSVNFNDHMVTYKISDAHYVIAWEDTGLSSSDRDYNDFVAEVMFVMPVPVPAALVLLGSALFGLGAFLRSSR